MFIQARVAGTSKIKIGAVKAAITALNHEYDVGADFGVPGSKSGVPEQPWSQELGTLGAENRANGAAAPGYYTFGIENYIDAEGTQEDYAMVVIITPSGRRVVRRSVGVPVPPELIVESFKMGWSVTCGMLEAARTPGLDHTNPHTKWSDGQMSREKQLIAVLVEALSAAIRAENIPQTTTLSINGVTRDLPVCWVDSYNQRDVYISLLELAGDAGLTEAAGKALAALMPKDVDILIMPYGKALPLLQVVQHETGLPAVVARKNQAPYMPKPVYKTPGNSITSGSSTFYLGADKAQQLKGKKVAFLDDVVSRRGTLKAITSMLQEIGVREIVVLAVATEGVRHEDVIALAHFDVHLA